MHFFNDLFLNFRFFVYLYSLLYMLCIFLFFYFICVIIVAGFLKKNSHKFFQWIGIRTGLSLPSGWELFWQLFIYFVIEDFSNYWIHRMLHCKWAFEKIHKVHHEYVAPIGLSAPYAHWAEIIILGIPSFLGPVLVPGHITTYWLWFILRQLEAIETHSG